jgi:hypothetical protein
MGWKISYFVYLILLSCFQVSLEARIIWYHLLWPEIMLSFWWPLQPLKWANWNPWTIMNSCIMETAGKYYTTFFFKLVSYLRFPYLHQSDDAWPTFGQKLIWSNWKEKRSSWTRVLAGNGSPENDCSIINIQRWWQSPKEFLLVVCQITSMWYWVNEVRFGSWWC